MPTRQKKSKSLSQLFFSAFSLSALTFGGGYVIVSLMKKRFVDEWHWLKEDEMLDLIAIAQSAPGAIAVNGAIVLGYQIAGLLGILVTIIGTILPPFLIIHLIAWSYQIFSQCHYVAWLLEGMQAGVGAVIASVVLDMGSGLLRQGSPFLTVLMILTFVANYCFKISLPLILLIYLAIAAILYWRQSTSHSSTDSHV